MNKKRIAQYCCAALVASGIGLNIQNAIENYGIGENSLSLVATGGTGMSGSSSCFEGSISFGGSCSYTNYRTVDMTIKRCGVYYGDWKVTGREYQESSFIGPAILIWDAWEKLTYWEYTPFPKMEPRMDKDGKIYTYFFTRYECRKYHGTSNSNCEEGQSFDIAGWNGRPGPH